MGKIYKIQQKAKRLVARFSFTIDVVVILIGIIAVLLGNKGTGKGEASSSAVDSTVSNIGCSLIASGIVSLVAFPRLELPEEFYQKIYMGYGLEEIITDSSQDEILRGICIQKEHFDVIIDDPIVLQNIVEKENDLKSLKVRLLVQQPAHCTGEGLNYQLETALTAIKQNENGIEIRYYSGDRLPFYCKQGNAVFSGRPANKLGTTGIYKYSAEGIIGKAEIIAFDEIWKGKASKIKLSKMTFGRYSCQQRECIEKALDHCCDTCEKLLGLKTKIEAVVVVWTSKKEQRRTIYSCNKPDWKEPHSIRPYAYGVVGLLQAQLEKSSSNKANGILLYDKEKSPNTCECCLEWRPLAKTLNISEIEVEEQEWKDTQTKTMLAISLYYQHGDVPEMFGALTFDFAETLKDSLYTTEDLFLYIISCRDMLLPLLATNIEPDSEMEMIQLEYEEAKKKEGV